MHSIYSNTRITVIYCKIYSGRNLQALYIVQ